MGKCLNITVLSVAVLVGAILYKYPCLLKCPEVPKMPSHRWWGKGNEPSTAAQDQIESRPFKVQIQDSVLQDLKHRLQRTRISPPLEGVAFQYGFNTDYLKTVLDYWTNKYDWKKEEARLNTYPHFLAKIEGIDVHYIHAKPTGLDKKVKVLPLLMIHGWPGSFVEFYKIIPLLTSGESGVAFEIICPSIPGYGFSEAPHHPGFTAADAARVFTKLMGSLGHQKFYVQGGDWGSLIATPMSILYPEKLYGSHVNMAAVKYGFMTYVKYLVGLVAPSLIFDENQQYNVYPAGQFFSNMILESGYAHLQATKPDTVGVGLGDSPAGLAAYILEKFSSWTDMDNREKKDGGLLVKYNMDELLTNVMVYWVTNSITSSARFYKENLSPSYMKFKFDSLPIHVPAGVAVAPHELMTFPRTIVKHKYSNLLTYNYLKRGGHFAAMEEPQLMAEDIRTFVSAAEAHLEKERQEKDRKK